MIFARFSEDEANNKSLQRIIMRFQDTLSRGPPAFIDTTPAVQAVAKEILGLTSSNFDTRASSDVPSNDNRIISGKTHGTSERGC